MNKLRKFLKAFCIFFFFVCKMKIKTIALLIPCFLCEAIDVKQMWIINNALQMYCFYHYYYYWWIMSFQLSSLRKGNFATCLFLSFLKLVPASLGWAQVLISQRQSDGFRKYKCWLCVTVYIASSLGHVQNYWVATKPSGSLNTALRRLLFLFLLVFAPSQDLF